MVGRYGEVTVRSGQVTASSSQEQRALTIHGRFASLTLWSGLVLLGFVLKTVTVKTNHDDVF